MNFVLEPLKLEKLKLIFDNNALEIIKYFIKKSVFLQPEIKEGQEVKAIQIPKEHLEQWCVQALGATAIGAGSYPIDILLEGEYGADIKSLMCKISKDGKLANSESGEASLAQKFKDTGESLDSLFKDKKYEEIKTGWLEIVKNKNSDLKEKHNISEIFYFFFLNAGDRFYLCATELNLENLVGVGVDNERSTADSVYLNGYIDSSYGSTKIYKAKKRLELRLKPKQLVEDGYCIELEIPKDSFKIDLREEYEKNSGLDEYIKNTVETYFLK